MAEEIKAKDSELVELGKKRGGAMSKAHDVAKAQEDALSKELVRLSTVWKNKVHPPSCPHARAQNSRLLSHATRA